MNLREDTNWLELYQTLGIEPGCEWSQVQTAYRRMAQSRHPDRFEEGSTEHREAQDQIIEINHAYAKLSAYYKTHGYLPGNRYSAPKTDRKPGSSGQSRSETATSRSGSSWRVPAENRKKPFLRRRSTILLSLALAYGAYHLWPLDRYLSEAPGEYESAEPGENPETPPTALLGESRSSIEPANSFFGPGSTMGEVYAVQGNPTRTSGSTWYYGNSSVTFAKGIVDSWKEDPDFPLKIRVDSDKLDLRTRHSRLTSRFTYGSTKADVEAIQGQPVTKTNDVWDYGVSRVYFKNNHVVSWVNSPMQPLKVNEEP